jgi:photosystem II stability/assembly factor-like uncharacterized protein
MKKYFIIAICIVITQQNLLAQGWQWIDTGYPYIIFDICFPQGQSEVGFAVGSTFTVGGDGAVLKTTDAGLSWNKITIDTVPGLKAVCFTSLNVGYAAGFQNFFMKTTNGGINWEKIIVDTKLWYFNNIEFWDENNGIIVSYASDVYYTTNGGDSWSASSGVKRGVEDICYASQNILYLVGGDEKIYKSTDSGIYWFQVYGGISLQSLLGVEFLNETYGIVTGEDGKVLVTTDGGVSWITSSTGNSGLLRGVHILNDQDSYVAGTPEQVYKTTNGGTTWISDFAGGNTVALYKIIFTENNIGLICGSEGKMLRNTDFVIPVELVSFSAYVNEDDVELSWSTKSEINNSGFQIERSQNNIKWDYLTFISGSGTSTEANNYSFRDVKLKPGKYFYRLNQIDFDGSFEYSKIVNVTISVPEAFKLEQNYPNPFNPSTIIEFSLPEDVSNVKLSIYNTLGEMVAELVNTKLAAGKYSYQWNEKNVATGTYIYELRTEKFVAVKKMLILK